MFNLLMYNMGLIGNCQVSALVSQNGSLDWLCLPRPDSPPVFGRLLDKEGGYFSIEGADQARSRQSYIANTNILVTEIENSDGSQFKVTDFCPRFIQHGRTFRPISLFRMAEPVKGSPRIKVACRPVNGWEKIPLKPIRGNNHLSFSSSSDQLRVLTNMSLTYLTEETSFVLSEPLYFGFTWNSAIEEDLPQLTHRFLDQTLDYWRTWVKHCSIPTWYQKETIRSALVLKMHCYEDTGAILAAPTTSLPEEVGAQRNWDYRFCWLRDAYFSLTAFRNLGQFEEMEGFLKFLLEMAHAQHYSEEDLKPVYRLDLSLPIPEIIHPNWSGYASTKPVRSGNQAAEHIQNDVYGEMILALTPIYLDERFQHLRTPDHEKLLERILGNCIKNISKPDAGVWEIRNGWQEHSFSNLMCWAGIERMNKIKNQGYLKASKYNPEKAIEHAKEAIEKAVFEGTLRNGPSDKSLDSALLLMPILRYPDEKLCKKTVMTIAEELKFKQKNDESAFIYRYSRNDDFGTPKSAFLVCSFWLVQALAKIGEKEKAQNIMKNVGKAANPLGLYAEHFVPDSNEQKGNFPQGYSHIGQINAAFEVSPTWNEIL